MRRARKGAVMVVTLAVLTGLVAVLAAAAATQRVAFRAGLNRIEERRSKLIAEAACQFVIANLATQSKTSTLQTDDWATLKVMTSQDRRLAAVSKLSRVRVESS